MIVCSNCRHANIAGAAFCSECGAPLAPTTSATHDIGPLQEPEAPPAKAAAQEAPAEAPPVPSQGLADNWLTLHLLDTGQMLPLAERNEFTLGRISEGQPIMPDIDLSPYQAYANGVSRLHAVIKRGHGFHRPDGPGFRQRDVPERQTPQSERGEGPRQWRRRRPGPPQDPDPVETSLKKG